MRSMIFATATLIALSAPLAAQSVNLPTLTFPEPGTFCGPLQLCAPEVITQDARD